MTSTSGNAIADRRFDMARQLHTRGDVAAALDLMAQTLELVPTWPEGHFVLAEMMLDAGQTEAAIAALRAYSALDPADSMGAAAKLAGLGIASTQDLSPAYVERLFDQYAPRFDKALVEGLKYTAPQHIRRAIDEHFPHRRFARCLDLGCGTGLMGAAVRDIVEKLEGVDLSAGMLAEAGRKKIYDELRHGGLMDALTSRRETYDLILAADVLVYIGELSGVITATAHALIAGGAVAFTLQAGDANFSLGPDQRFRHSQANVSSALSAAGLRLVNVTHDSFRQERNVDVPGLLVVATKPN